MPSPESTFLSIHSIPQVFSSLSALVQAQHEDDQKAKLSKLSWFADVWHIRGSTIGRIWKAVVVVTIWATIVAVLEDYYEKDLNLTNNVVPQLSIVVGLVLVFRNSTAFSRWDDGRKFASSLNTQCRFLSRMIWVNVRHKHASSDPDPSEEDRVKLTREKKKALRMLVAFVISVKHHVRGEWGTEWEDLRSVLPHNFEKLFGTTGYGYGAADADHSSSLHSSGGHKTHRATSLSRFLHRHPSLPKRIPPPIITKVPYRSASSTVPVPIPKASRKQDRRVSFEGVRVGSEGVGSPTTRTFDSSITAHPGSGDLTITVEGPESEASPLLGNGVGSSEIFEGETVILHNYLSKPSLPLPLIISSQLSLWFADWKERGLMESLGPAGYNTVNATLNTLTDTFAQMERLASMSMPTVYVVHLKQCVTFYLFALPLVLVESMSWKMVPFVTLVAFTLMGIEGIASEIEMPFGNDASDLPLDLLCAELRNEIEHFMARLPERLEHESIE